MAFILESYGEDIFDVIVSRLTFQKFSLYTGKKKLDLGLSLNWEKETRLGFESQLDHSLALFHWAPHFSSSVLQDGPAFKTE